MKPINYIVVAIAIIFAVMPTIIFFKKKNYHDRLPEMKKACHDSKSTFEWLLEVFPFIHIDDKIITEKEAIRLDEKEGEGWNRHQWAREILIDSVKREVSFEERLQLSMDYLYKEKINGYKCPNS